MNKIPKISLEKQAQYILTQKLVHTLNGNYKGYKKATIEYAELVSKNMDITKKIQKPKATISIFSPLLPIYAFRIAKVLIRDLFRKKTPAEKLLKTVCRQNKLDKRI